MAHFLVYIKRAVDFAITGAITTKMVIKEILAVITFPFLLPNGFF